MKFEQGLIIVNLTKKCYNHFFSYKSTTTLFQRKTKRKKIKQKT